MRSKINVGQLRDFLSVKSHHRTMRIRYLLRCSPIDLLGLKTRLITLCTKQRENPANLVTSRKINTRLARPIVLKIS